MSYCKEPEIETAQDLIHQIETLIDQKYDYPVQYTSERPILIESDNDELEENSTVHSYAVCERCNCSISTRQECEREYSSTSFSLCTNCSNKINRGSQMYNNEPLSVFGLLTHKLKQSVTPINHLPAEHGTYKGMEYDQADNALLDIPSPCPSRPSSRPTSRPSSRASSFIEDIKLFLSPFHNGLSRKSSKNSFHSENQQGQPKKKTSCTSLFDAFNLCKTKSRGSSSYPENEWSYGDNPQNYSGLSDDPLNMDNCFVGIRRQQIMEIENRQDRVTIYNNIFNECMDTSTSLLKWIINQNQKGPPDAWFGYTPPLKQPKKILGIFKRKQKAVDYNHPQQNLDNDTSNILEPILPYNSQHLSKSTSHLLQEDAYCSRLKNTGSELHWDTKQKSSDDYSSPDLIEKKDMKPRSILKKPSSSTHHIKHKIYDDEEDDDDDDSSFVYTGRYSYSHNSADDSSEDIPIKSPYHSRHSKSSDDYYDHNKRDSYLPRRRSYVHKMNSAVYNEIPKKKQYHSPNDYSTNSYYDSFEEGSPRHDIDYYDRDADTHPVNRPKMHRRSSSNPRHASSLRRETVDYIKDEWEIALDDLSRIFPKVDRQYLDGFLSSAEGDFILAKDMIMDMVINK